MAVIRDFANWYFSKTTLPYWCILAIDSLIVLFSGYVSMYVMLGQEACTGNFWSISIVIFISLIPYIVGFRLFHTYSGFIRYSSFDDLSRLVMATLVGCGGNLAIDTVACMIQHGGLMLPWLSAIFFQGLIATLLLWLERVMIKRLFDGYHIEKAVPVVIYGTKAGGISIAQSLGAVNNKKYALEGFISDKEEMEGSFIMGKKVHLNHSGLAAELAKDGVRHMLVSPLKINRLRNNQKMIDEFIAAGIKIRIRTEDKEWDGKSSINYEQLHEVNVEDLLPRDKINVDMDAIGRQLNGKRIMVTGAAGSIGSEMVRQIARFEPSEMVLIDQAETPMHDIRQLMANQFGSIRCETIVTSITNREHMEKIFDVHRPEYVFHAAAYKHVPMMEDNPAIAIQNNVQGTRVIADLAVKYGTLKFVMISTDKAVNPTNVMGCSKRICEIYCQSLNQAIAEGKVKGVTQFVTTRFGNVLGSNGSVIPTFKEQIRKGGPVTVTHPDIIRFFMLIPEACKLVLEAGTMGNGGEIFVFDMGKPVKIVELARRMIALSGAKNVQITFSGLRDGEKLYEEVLSDKEKTLPTSHPKIMVAKVRGYDYETAKKNEDRLTEVSTSFDDMEIVRVMKEIVPEFKSSKSKYEILDK